MSHKKLFRAIDADTLEALFIGKYDTAPSGWYETREEAKAALAVSVDPSVVSNTYTLDTEAQVAATITGHDTQKRRGRPRKVDVVSTEEV